ncbi:hypothetical protein PI124_g16326 [Phytophthora idaei]|nr:hypothetical protein PI124_g16326 [Phytophthora idaei]
MEAPEQLKQNSYAEAKSPNVENDISLGQHENGALRAPRGSVSVYSWENFGMAAHSAGVVPSQSPCLHRGFNGTMIEISQQEPAHLRGTAMGDCDVVFYWFAIVSAFFTGLGLNSEDYGGTFSWKSASRPVRPMLQ